MLPRHAEWHNVHAVYVQLFKSHHINQATCQGKFIGRKIKKRVIGYRNLVVKQIFGKEVEPGGLVISYKVYLVAAVGQGFAKLGGYNPAAAKGWVTNYSDFHLMGRCCLIW
jgi:hypothetical protein